MAEKQLMYKGRPLARSGNQIYLGYPSEPYVACLLVLSTIPQGNLSVADRVMVQLLSTDESKPPLERIAKKAEKQGLYEALNIASIWLDRYLADSKS